MGKRDTLKADRRGETLREISKGLCKLMELDVVLQHSSLYGLKQ
jgi:hypothetical protein